MGKYIISWNDGNGSIRWAQYDPTIPEPTQHWTNFDINGIGSIDNQSAPQIASLYQRRILIVWNKINQQIYSCIIGGNGSPTALETLDWSLMDCKPVTPVRKGASTSDNPALCTFGNRAAVAFKGENNQVYYNIFHHNQSNDWDGVRCVKDGFTNSVPALAFSDESILIAFKGVKDDKRIFYSVDGKAVKEVEDVKTRNVPALCSFGKNVLMAWKQEGPNQEICYSIYDQNSWSKVEPVIDAATNMVPVLCSFNNKVLMTWKGPDEDHKIRYSIYDGDTKNWKNVSCVPVATTNDVPASAFAGSSIVIAFKPVDDKQISYIFSGPLHSPDWAPITFANNATSPTITPSLIWTYY